MKALRPLLMLPALVFGFVLFGSLYAKYLAMPPDVLGFLAGCAALGFGAWGVYLAAVLLRAVVRSGRRPPPPGP